ncbi:GTP 3',8-cyclase MoaA [Aromatoleum bremense]|uniref:GTP 3',8-cyclase MoaA n=1 Tax=Aromatoleum bremense TaxID=76115 RepID=A0ABX1P1C3_9RHOO|nr:GTP 3',8-cyclase MoaA [Aromatoleum bremense]NMG17853.1 GTP 3',8-cyclase MoaA [Aromatoleum bremense]
MPTSPTRKSRSRRASASASQFRSGTFARGSRVRLTGGEPLTRPGLVELASRLGEISGVRDLSLSTNGTLLAQHAKGLRAAGVKRINVSLDSLQRERFTTITRRDRLASVLEGLDCAKECHFSPIKVNMVILTGVNDDEIDAMVEFCLGQGFILRLIEAMPVEDVGWRTSQFDLAAVRDQLRRRFGLIDGVVPGGGPARYLRTVRGDFSIGFITPVTQHFCESCNRVRLSVDGTLYLCLGEQNNVDLRGPMRSGATDTNLADIIRGALNRKPLRHDFSQAANKAMRSMVKIGG